MTLAVATAAGAGIWALKYLLPVIAPTLASYFLLSGKAEEGDAIKREKKKRGEAERSKFLETVAEEARDARFEESIDPAFAEIAQLMGARLGGPGGESGDAGVDFSGLMNEGLDTEEGTPDDAIRQLLGATPAEIIGATEAPMSPAVAMFGGPLPRLEDRLGGMTSG